MQSGWHNLIYVRSARQIACRVHRKPLSSLLLLFWIVFVNKIIRGHEDDFANTDIENSLRKDLEDLARDADFKKTGMTTIVV